MPTSDAANNPPTLDALIIGAGLGGLLALKYAKDMGLTALALEMQNGIGGLWRKLPAWQDIQIGLQDWSLAGLPIHGPEQPHILANLEALADRFRLREQIQFNAPVVRAEFREGIWHVHTALGTIYSARNLVVASGAHNLPHIPSVERSTLAPPRLMEMHSSALQDPKILRGKSVAIVGGGASAYDLLELAFAEGAREVHWVHRGLVWFNPSLRPKHEVAQLRRLGRRQLLGLPRKKINAKLAEHLQKKYAKYGLEEILPKAPLDLDQHHVIPGRPGMIRHFAQIKRYPGTVQSLADQRISLSTGQEISAELLLWATGYRLNLRYLELPEFKACDRAPELWSQLGSQCVAKAYPGLYFLGLATLDSNGSAPWGHAHMAKAIMGEIAGKSRIRRDRVERFCNYLELAWQLFPEGKPLRQKLAWLRYASLFFRPGAARSLPLP